MAIGDNGQQSFNSMEGEVTIAGKTIDPGLLTLTTMALVAAAMCLVVGARQGRAGWPALVVGVLLLLPVGLVAVMFLLAS